MSAQLLPAALEPPLDRPVADCRVYERIACALPSTCQPASVLEMKEMRWAATIIDISQGGVRLLLTRRFEKGAALAVELPGDLDHDSTVVFVKVVHLRSEGNGTWSLGCRFVSELSGDEMQRLLSSTSHVLSSSKEHPSDETDSPSDETHQRLDVESANRQAYLTNVQLLLETQDGAVLQCVIRKLHTARSGPLAPGKVLSINGKSRAGSDWTLRFQVAECVEQGKGWEVKGRVLGPASANDIAQQLARA